MKVKKNRLLVIVVGFLACHGMRGSHVTQTAPVSGLTENGTVTDGTSGGALPSVSVTVLDGVNIGKSSQADGAGHYTIDGLASDTFSLSASANRHQTVTKAVPQPASTLIDFVLPRLSPDVPAPAAAARLTVRTYDSVGLGSSETAIARDTASAILRDAGLQMAWRDCTVGCTDPLKSNEVLVRIVTAPKAALPGSLGYSVVDMERRTGTLATIYADRLTSIARRTGTDAGRLIGRAIAHEIGHLLLGTSHHSPAGLMRAHWADREVAGDRKPDWTLSPPDIAKLGVGVGGLSAAFARAPKPAAAPATTQTIGDYLTILHAQNRRTFDTDKKALERQAAADDTIHSGGTIRKVGELYVASVQGFVNDSVSFVRTTSQTVLIDTAAVATLFSTYRDRDATYASTVLFSSSIFLGSGAGSAQDVGDIHTQTNAAYALAILQFP